MENVILTLYFCSYYAQLCQFPVVLRADMRLTDFCEMLLHHFWAVIDGQDDICDSSSCQRFNLVQNHGLVSKLDQWLGQSEGLPLR
jgi:hypothetical protein